MSLYKEEFTKDIYTHFNEYYDTRGATIITDEQIVQFTDVFENKYIHNHIIKQIDFLLDKNLIDRFYCQDYIHIGTRNEEVNIFEPERGYISDNQKEMLLLFIEQLKRVQEEDPTKTFDFLYFGDNIYYRINDIEKILSFITLLETNNNNLHKDTDIIGWTKDEFLNLSSNSETKILSKNKKR